MREYLNTRIVAILFCLFAFAINGCGSSGGGGGSSLPDVPSNVAATAGNEQVTVNWDAVAGADSYNLYWSTDPNATTYKKITGATAPYVLNGLTNGTTYYCAVTAVNIVGESNISSIVSATPQLPMPGVPANVTISAGNRQATISWDPVDFAQSYNIYWKNDSGVTTADNKIENVTSPYVHTGLNNGVRYYYVVTAVNSTGESGLSSEVSATPTFTNEVLNMILASDPQEKAYFGYSVSINRDYAIVGAYGETDGSKTGAAYIFHRIHNSWDNGTKIVSPDPQASAYFGYSVSINGDYAIVGAYGDGGPNNNQPFTGAAYIFHRDKKSENENLWDTGTKIVAADGASQDWFGYSVAISGDYAIVGAKQNSGRDYYAGAAYIFHRTGDNSWDTGKKVLAFDGKAADFFGSSVAISGDYAIVGAYFNGEKGYQAGAAYIFHRTGDSWDTGTKILAADGAALDYFGYSVAIDGKYAIVGAYLNDEKGTDAGAAYIFHRTDDSWDTGTKIVAPDAAAIDWFGRSVGISGDYVIVGANLNDEKGTDAGAAYIFHRAGDSWDTGTKIVAPDTLGGFGNSSAISENYAIVGNGNSVGAAYLY